MNSLRFYQKIRSAAYTKRAKTEFTLPSKLPLKSILVYKYLKYYTNSSAKLCKILNTFKWKKGIAEETKYLTPDNTRELKHGFRNFVRFSFLSLLSPKTLRSHTLKTCAVFLALHNGEIASSVLSVYC